MKPLRLRAGNLGTNKIPRQVNPNNVFVLTYFRSRYTTLNRITISDPKHVVLGLIRNRQQRNNLDCDIQEYK
jgi:hypothetical protein